MKIAIKVSKRSVVTNQLEMLAKGASNRENQMFLE